MFASALVYAGFVLAVAGLVLCFRPIRRLGVSSRRRALGVLATGTVLTLAAFLPATESRVSHPVSRLDEFAPAWQFHEIHTRRIDAPAERVYNAIRSVRADEIALFETLTWIRRGGRHAPPSILNAAGRTSLIDIATENGFVRLVDDPPRELVVGTVVLAPRGAPGALTAALFQRPLPPGFALATMNFLVTPDGANRSVVTTETRVYASGPDARRRFAVYWRMIYPGSALIRRMWLRAIDRRATAPG